MEILGIDVNSNEALSESHELFFEKAKARIEEIGENAPADVHSFKKLFKHPSGVVTVVFTGILTATIVFRIFRNNP